MSRPRVLIADDNEAMRCMLRLILSGQCEIIGEAESGKDALEAAARLLPDLLIVDVSMPGMSGFDVARILKERAPEARIIITSHHNQRSYVDEAIRLGVQGYMLKQTCVTEAAAAIREVLAGRWFESRDIPAKVVNAKGLTGSTR